MPETIRGTIQKTYHSSPGFSAGTLTADDSRTVRFAGKFCANEGDVVALVGRWKHDAKYGRQFAVESLSYELPESAEGLVNYLAKHSAFTGIGEATARRIVTYATSAANLDRIIRQDVDELHRQLRVPRSTLESLREAWIAHSAENEVRAYLSGFGLSAHQVEILLDKFGNSIVGVLRSDPYQLIQHVRGYGFKKVDKIARGMGTPKDHPGRIEAGIQYVVAEEISNGHTWVGGADLVEKANELLLLDTLDSRDIIRDAGMRLLGRGDLASDGDAISTSYIRDAERLIQNTFAGYSTWRMFRAPPLRIRTDDLKPKQIEAIHNACNHALTVISGGAGTGKTYTLARLAAAFRDAGLNIALCSPTGKAAKRIEESLRAQGVALEAKTIHRLLQYDGTQFNRHSLSDPVPADLDDEHDVGQPGYDVVIVDEVSMVDVPLLAELLRRINFACTRLILVGDHNQLPPVGPGNVLRDIIAHRLVPLVVLDEIVRQAGVLKANSSAILTGVIAPTAMNDAAWTVVDAFQDALPIQAYLRDLILKKLPERLGVNPVRDVQIITPTHLGALGTKAINQMMQHLLHGDPGRKFAVGDKVIQTSNNYDLGVMNGTIGRVVDYEPGTEGGYRIDFDGVGARQIKGDAVHNVQLAYALTAHKAQGSEFPCAVVLCHRSHFFADRNWLYTAVTRAAKYCVLIGDQWGLRNAARKNHVIHRRTFLDRWARAPTGGVRNGQELVHA
ncbi:MAG: ATP-dependent RecD-like DNA helicase [Phycisphaerae bacterium]|nr:ATP-dependent RecD-like DNA helicase [Phycisphaerae bacterium]